MAECNVSIDQERLPGVKEVCRDFAVLEDHSLAYNLQEQEIESHLASNVHKSRLVQHDLQVAKKLQEEEDKQAKIQSQKQNSDIERQDVEIAQEIQEELVRQAEQQRQQEEKDAAIARRLQEKEMKEERKRQKQLEANLEEGYSEDHGASRSLDADKHPSLKSHGPGYNAHSPVRSRSERSPDYLSTDSKSKHLKPDSASQQGRSRYPKYCLEGEGGHSRRGDSYPEHSLSSKGRDGERYSEFESAHAGRARDRVGRDPDGVVRRKERPARPPPPQSYDEKDRECDRERQRPEKVRDYKTEEQHRRDEEQDLRLGPETERGHSGDTLKERDRPRHRERPRRREGALDLDTVDSGPIRKSRNSWEEEDDDRESRTRNRHQHRPQSEYLNGDGGDGREVWDPRRGEAPGRERSYSHPSRETGHVAHRGSGAAKPELEYGLEEATQGLSELELKDLEVARKLQEEEIKASKMHERAAQVAKDEEIARLLMEKEKREYKKNREKEKERERMAMERRRPAGNDRHSFEEVVRPRTRDEYDPHRQRKQDKPVRPPQPRTHDYENVSPGYGYSNHPAASRPPTRPEAAHRGAYHKR